MEKLLTQLIKFRTTSESINSSEFDKLYFFVINELKNIPLITEKYSSQGHASWLFSTDKNPSILLAAHADVVPGTQNMFNPVIKNNILYGRGAIDMKFALATFIHVLKNLNNNLSNYSIGLLITSDEEVGGVNGTQFVLQRTKIKPDCVLLPDGGRNWTIEHAEKGFWHVRLTSSGKAAHGSRPWLGKNAIDKLINAYNYVHSLYPSPLNDEWVNTINAGRINGGQAVNIVPDFAHIDLDIRYINPKSKYIIQKTLSNLHKQGIEVETITEGSPFNLPESNKYLKKYQRIAKDRLGTNLPIIKSSGSSDARYFAKQSIPVIISGPVGDGIHSDHEWIDLSSLQTYQDIVQSFIVSNSK